MSTVQVPVINTGRQRRGENAAGGSNIFGDDLNQSSAGVIPINGMYEDDDAREAQIPQALEEEDEQPEELTDAKPVEEEIKQQPI